MKFKILRLMGFKVGIFLISPIDMWQVSGNPSKVCGFFSQCLRVTSTT